MRSDPHLLFIYGTLHPDRAPGVIAQATSRLKRVGEATIRGRLVDLGEYPGLVLDAADPEIGEISGEVFECPDLATLAQLDAYEGFYPDDPGASLFVRVEVTVTLRDGSPLRCWVYTLPTPVK